MCTSKYLVAQVSGWKWGESAHVDKAVLWLALVNSIRGIRTCAYNAPFLTRALSALQLIQHSQVIQNMQVPQMQSQAFVTHSLHTHTRMHAHIHAQTQTRTCMHSHAHTHTHALCHCLSVCFSLSPPPYTHTHTNTQGGKAGCSSVLNGRFGITCSCKFKWF